MQDIDIIGSRNQSFFAIRRDCLENIPTKIELEFGSIKPIVNANCTCLPEIWNYFIRYGFHLYFTEKQYFDYIKDSLNDSPCVHDFSDNVLSSYLSDIEDSSICSYTVSNTDAIAKVIESGLSKPLSIHLALTSSIVDVGCTLEELKNVFAFAQGHSQSIFSIYFKCNRADQVSEAISYFEKAVEMGKIYNMPITTLFLLGDGVGELSKAKDPDSKKIMDQLKTLAKQYTVFADLSRVLTSDLIVLYIRIIGKKTKVLREIKKTLYYADNGVYNSLYSAHIYYEHLNPKPISLHGEDFSKETELQECTIFGPTCDSIDCLGTEFMLPQLRIGDWLKFEGNGYKCGTYSTKFNGFENPSVCFIYACLL